MFYLELQEEVYGLRRWRFKNALDLVKFVTRNDITAKNAKLLAKCRYDGFIEKILWESRC